MLCREVIAVYCENHTKHKNSLCGKLQCRIDCKTVITHSYCSAIGCCFSCPLPMASEMHHNATFASSLNRMLQQSFSLFYAWNVYSVPWNMFSISCWTVNLFNNSVWNLLVTLRIEWNVKIFVHRLGAQGIVSCTMWRLCSSIHFDRLRTLVKNSIQGWQDLFEYRTTKLARTDREK
jgi:hypothetical protein